MPRPEGTIASDLLALATTSLALALLAAALVATDEARVGASCARDGGFLCGFGQSVLTGVAQNALPALALAGVMLLVLAWRAARSPPASGLQSAIGHAAPFLVATLLAALLAARARANLRGCAAELSCLRGWLDTLGYAGSAIFVLGVAAVLSAFAGAGVLRIRRAQQRSARQTVK